MTTATATISPEKIKEDIENLLQADNRVDARDIAVKVTGGAVRLTGTVPDHAARRIAEADAAIVPGVGEVDNHLRVRSPEGWEQPPDTAIKRNVERALRWQSGVDTSGIAVTVRDGTVMLDGTVSSYWQKFRLQDLALNVTGVIDIDNSVTIAPLRAFTDDLIREDIVAELSRNTGAAGERIDVTVENGVVTLGGSVPDLSTYRAAETITYYINGVIVVKNELYIQPQNIPEE
jgi:osmotically-inducible protein OsmY